MFKLKREIFFCPKKSVHDIFKFYIYFSSYQIQFLKIPIVLKKIIFKFVFTMLFQTTANIHKLKAKMK